MRRRIQHRWLREVLSQGEFPSFPGVYMTPAQLRAKMDERGWQKVAALQLRNPVPLA